jgi:hypothetical protein
MSLAELKAQAALLTDAERRALLSYIVSLRPGYEAHRAMITRKIDDNDPAHWVDGSELRKFLETED